MYVIEQAYPEEVCFEENLIVCDREQTADTFSNFSFIIKSTYLL